MQWSDRNFSRQKARFEPSNLVWIARLKSRFASIESIAYLPTRPSKRQKVWTSGTSLTPTQQIEWRRSSQGSSDRVDPLTRHMKTNCRTSLMMQAPLLTISLPARLAVVSPKNLSRTACMRSAWLRASYHHRQTSIATRRSLSGRRHSNWRN